MLDNHQDRTKTMISLALFCAIAIILHTVDRYVSIFLPLGFKLGIANIVSLVVLKVYGPKEVGIVNGVRVILAGLLTGEFLTQTFWMSCGGVFCSTVMIIVVDYWTDLSFVSLSCVGAIFHNVGQIIVLSLVMKTTMFIPYLFLLSLCSLVTGIGNGLVSFEVHKRIQSKKIFS